MSIVGRSYLDPGDKLGGKFDPWRPCTVLIQWGKGRGPRMVLVRYATGTEHVIPFSRRLRKSTVDHRSTPGVEPVGSSLIRADLAEMESDAA